MVTITWLTHIVIYLSWNLKNEYGYKKGFSTIVIFRSHQPSILHSEDDTAGCQITADSWRFKGDNEW